MKRRWTILIRVVLALILLTVVGGYLALFEFGGIEDIAEGQLLDNLPLDEGVVLHIERIGGSLFSGIELSGVSLVRREATGDDTLIWIGEATAAYDLDDLLNSRFHFSSVRVDDLRARLYTDSAGKIDLPLVLPKKSPTAESGADTTTRSSDGLSLSFENLSLSNADISLFLKSDTIVVTDLGLYGALASEHDLISADIKFLSYECVPKLYDLTSLSGRLTISGNWATFDGLNLVQGNSRVTVDGRVDLKTYASTLSLAADQIDLNDVQAYGGPKLNGIIDLNGRIKFANDTLSGQMQLGGGLSVFHFENLYTSFRFAERHLFMDTLYGTILEQCGIDGGGFINFGGRPENYELNANIKNFNLSHLISTDLPSDLSGTINLNGIGFTNEELALNITTDLSESSFDGYPVQVAGGTMRVTVDSITFPEPFRVQHFENSFMVEGTIRYADSLSLRVSADMQNLDRYRDRFFINKMAGRVQAEISVDGLTDDPNIAGAFLSDSLWLYSIYTDSAFGRVDIDNFLNQRSGSTELDLIVGEAWGIGFDSARARVSVDSMTAFLEDISIYDSLVHVGASGRYVYGIDPGRLELDSFSMDLLDRQFDNKSMLLTLIDSVGMYFDKTEVTWRNASIAVDGSVNYDESMDLRVGLRDVNLGPWISLFQPDLDFTAHLKDLQAELAGEFISPQFSLNGEADSLVYRDLNLGQLQMQASYNNQMLRIDTAILVTANLVENPNDGDSLIPSGRYEASGYFPADLSFSSLPTERLPNDPFDLSVKAYDNRFDLVSLMLPSVEEMTGEFEANVNLTGTRSQPHLEGEAVLRQIALKYFDLVDQIRADSVRIKLLNNQILLDSIRTYVFDRRGQKKYAYVDGTVTVRTVDTIDYDLTMRIPESVPIRYELADMGGSMVGVLQVQGYNPPRVTGNLRIEQMRDRAEFPSGEADYQVMMAALGESTWDLDIDIDIPDNYIISNQDIDAEFSGFLNVKRINGVFRYAGQLDIVKGKGYLFDKTFNIEDGSSVTFEDVERPNPRLDITATTKIPTPQFDEETDRGQQYRELTLHIGGTLDNPEFGLPAGDTTGFTNEDILPLIVANYYGSESGLGGPFGERIAQLVSSRVAQYGGRTLGVETFEIDPTYEQGNLDLSKTRVTVGANVMRNLYLYGRTDVSFSGGQEVGFEYRVPAIGVLIGTRRDELNLWHLNVKWHREF